MKILFASSEAHPLIKTGGLGDVSASLPAALEALGHDVRLVLPAYRTVLDQIGPVRIIGRVGAPGVAEPLRVLEAAMPGSGLPLLLVDAPTLFDRAGAPYTDPNGKDWPDNAHRFAAFCRAVVELGMGRAGVDWRPEIVHCNDWQTGLVPALLSGERNRPATVFTIHNLAYQGVFEAKRFEALRLPPRLWSLDGLEFYGNLSFIKGGIAFADRISTVSPTYAREIRRPEFGYGLDGLLNHRADRLVGILNGADYTDWDPARDRYIVRTYSAETLEDKAESKRALQARMGLPEQADAALIGFVGRMVEQKGIDLVTAALPRLMTRKKVQLVALGTGERPLEEALRRSAARHDGRIAIHIGYSEELAHWIEAGADLFLMPSRFEPCGLNQIYSLRYGTLPVVRRTGGLADTVVDATASNRKAGRATGFVFEQPSGIALAAATERALKLFDDQTAWREMVHTAMAQDFSWEKSAARYIGLYESALVDNGVDQAPRRQRNLLK